MKRLTFKFLFCRFEILMKSHFIQKLLQSKYKQTRFTVMRFPF